MVLQTSEPLNFHMYTCVEDDVAGKSVVNSLCVVKFQLRKQLQKLQDIYV